ncbi:MAG TPA: TetR family transcriptional regulator C-terminal domain-containing protein [Steroidobacteraceae bacterium]|nr:TetR family transcriptional regulator C-terminal domain-containing protein [Steroidobacteraceae bacterium]
MPKIVDHEQRRDQIALVACRVVAGYGFDRATIVRIAREAGYTTGMIAHYFDTKQEIIVAALRLILRRIEERLTAAAEGESTPDLLVLLSEALPLDATRFTECAFWIAFWGQMSADTRLKRINAWMHREYLRLFERCLARAWSEWRRFNAHTREQVLRSVLTFVNGLTASAVANPGDWPPARQVAQLKLQLELLHAWAQSTCAARGAQRRRATAAGATARGARRAASAG